ncbi:ArgH [Actinidia rufa]|uniref:ArgH n=1 Tax=Actinidia rufa TaxID=165716 RepID=A0A7J0GF30_9ERIC|nr:ArgH [Actinidia rufa]
MEDPAPLGKRKLDTSVDALVEEFEEFWKPEMGEYSRKLVEFCCSKALISMCCNIEELINNESFNRFTFEMMRAWERPSYEDEESYTESVAKEKEDKRAPVEVDDEPGIGEDTFMWLGTQVPLVCDLVNGRFTFDTLTVSTGYRLYFPACDKCLKEIDKLTLTNCALYFEATGVLSFEDTIKLDLSKNIEHSVKPAAIGPWGAPLFDKAIVSESAELQEPVVLEFPEVASSTRRDHWLALIKEVMLLHQFLSKYNAKSPTQAWEMHSRTILGVIRLHAAREMMRICPLDPKSFLIFVLYNELPKGDYVLEELAESLKKADSGKPCGVSSILRCMNISQPDVLSTEVHEGVGEGISVSGQVENLSSLESAVEQVREEAKEIEVAKATAEGLKEEGISDSILVLMELLKPLKNVVPWFQEILTWQRPATAVVVIATSLVVIYKEWVGKALAVFFLWVVAKIIRARKEGIGNKCDKIVVCTASDQSAMETIISAQHGLQTARDMVQLANISILKIWSILLGKSPKHTNTVIVALTGVAIILFVVPIKYILMAVVLCCFTMNSKLGRHMANDKGNRRLKEWWEWLKSWTRLPRPIHNSSR